MHTLQMLPKTKPPFHKKGFYPPTSRKQVRIKIPRSFFIMLQVDMGIGKNKQDDDEIDECVNLRHSLVD